MAVHCYECGSSNPEGSDFCTRCGAALAPTALGDLVLPEWLTRAAAESSQPVEAPTLVPTLVPARVVATESNPRPVPTMAQAPIPTGDLAKTLPTWMKGAAAPPHSAPPVVEVEASLLIDPTDTRGFISEDDLPAWIRQIGIADAARKAEAERASVAVVEIEEEAAPVEPTPLRRRLLPGDVEAARATTSPWLTRGERPRIEEPVLRIQPAVVEPVMAPPQAIEQTPESPAPMSPSAQPEAAKASFLRGVNPRYLLLAALVVFLVVLIIAVAL